MSYIFDDVGVGARLTDNRFTSSDVPEKANHLTFSNHDPGETKRRYESVKAHMGNKFPLLHLGTNLIEDNLVDKIGPCYEMFVEDGSPRVISCHFGHPYPMDDLQYDPRGDSRYRLVKKDPDSNPIPPTEFLSMLEEKIGAILQLDDEMVLLLENMDYYPEFVKDSSDVEKIYSPYFIAGALHRFGDKFNGRVKMLFDYGHAQVSAKHLGRGDNEYMEPLLKYIVEIHLNDAGETDDKHPLMVDAHNPFTRWERLERDIAEMPNLHLVTFEVKETYTRRQFDEAIDTVQGILRKKKGPNSVHHGRASTK